MSSNIDTPFRNVDVTDAAEDQSNMYYFTNITFEVSSARIPIGLEC